MFRKNLAAKLILCLAFALVGTVGFFAYMNIKLQKKYLMDQMEMNAVQLSQTIVKSIKNDMMNARSDNVQRTIEEISKQGGIEKVRIFDKKGKIVTADYVQEIGTFVDKREQGCLVCHVGTDPPERLSARDMTRILKTAEGKRVLGIINPIYNETRCSASACHFHPSEQNILGIMDILLSMQGLDEQLGRNGRHIIIYFLFSFLLVSVLSSFFIFKFVNTPIRKLMQATKKIAKGDLKYRIESSRLDEIGMLAKSFDEMTSKLLASREEIEKWNMKLEDDVMKATGDLREANEQLKIANKKLQSLDEMKSDFMRRIEHGSRSHLSLIKSCLSLILSEHHSELSPKQADLIKTAERRSAAMIELLDDFLLLSYRRSVEGAYQMEPVQLRDLFMTLSAEIQSQCLLRVAEISVLVPVGFPQIWSDREGLKEIFSNVLNNAVKYTPEQGSITVSAKSSSNEVEILVSDTGIGIPGEDLEKIFDEFYRSRNAKTYKAEGTGLGLAIVKEIVETLHGRIVVQSELGKGTEFIVILPIAQA